MKLNLFDDLDEAELEMLLSRAELVEFEQGQYPIHEGDHDYHLFVILAGQVRISKRALGVQKTLETLGPGECFGEMSLIERRGRSASARAISHCKLLRLDREAITPLHEISAKIYRNIAILISRRLRHLNDVLTLG
ncbi:MAG TPA: cyclic nucleotide-binding domain-containing protein [Paucimonas sp.]|nr:cyclic nucleotide-binding domain-containing protein [Paucimonas sp.]